MSKMFSLVLVCVTVVALKDPVSATELCSQGLDWAILSNWLTNCIASNHRLISYLKDCQGVVNEAKFQLQEPNNLSSLEDFTVEMVKYNNIFSGLNSTMVEYMTTPDYKTQSTVTDVSIFAYKTSKYIVKELSDVGKVVLYMTMSSKVTITTPSTIQTTTGISQNTNLPTIYAETYYVTSKLRSVLNLWVTKNSNCTSRRRRSASM